ncbi:MAG: aspartate aminotransferase family protein [Solirubrobacterales bacterium]
MTSFWHPQSNMSHTRDHEVIFVRGEGSTLWDRDGKEYTDAIAGLWYCNVGYGREPIADAVRDQVAALHSCTCFDVYASDKTVALAERVAGMAPVDGAKVFFTCGGSESIDTAAKVVRRYWSALGKPEKHVMISREGAYHGLNAFGTSLAGIGANKEGFGALVEGIANVPAMDPGALADEIDRLDGAAAAFFAEPVIGAGGVHPPPEDYLKEVAAVCRDREVLFAVDEVITGFGRLGTMFASERYGVRPDILVVAKGITSGYQPLSAAIFSEQIAEPFWEDGAPWLRHGYTFSGHASGCAAGLANLDILEEEKLVDRVASLEPRLAEIVAPLAELDDVSEVRTVGLLAGVQLSPEARERDPGFADKAVAGIRDRGVITRKMAGDGIQISPPFVITEPELEKIVSAYSDAISAVGAEVASAA